MKTIKKIIWTLVACTLIVLSMTACGGKTADYEGVLGERFGLPYADNAEYTVIDPSGNAVEVFEGGFVPTAVGNYAYTIKGVSKGTVVVKDKTPPRIVTDFSFRYCAPGKIDLPEVTVTDDDGAVGYTVEVTRDGNPIAVADNAFTATIGDYEAEIVSTDAAGNTAKKTVYYRCTENAELLNSITAFEHEYGLQHVTRRQSFRPSFTSEVKHGAESGSLRLEFTADYQQAGGFFIDNVLIKDLTEFKGFYFYVYNESNVTKRLSVNLSHYINLTPNDWTEVRITDKRAFIGNSAYPAFKENFTFADVNGMLFYINDNANNIERQNFYVSNFYAIQ